MSVPKKPGTQSDASNTQFLPELPTTAPGQLTDWWAQVRTVLRRQDDTIAELARRVEALEQSNG